MIPDDDQLRRVLVRLAEVCGDTTNAGNAWYRGECGELDTFANSIGLRRGGYLLVDDWRAPGRLAAWKKQRETDDALRERVRVRIGEILRREWALTDMLSWARGANGG